MNGYTGLAEENGVLLVGVADGVARFVDGRTELAYPSPPGVRPLPAQVLLRDRDGGLWMATYGRGLVHFHDGRTDVFTGADGLSSDRVGEIFEDREGSVWVRTADGLDRFRDAAVPTYAASQTFSNDAVTSILAATDGALWVATLDGLNRWQQGHLTVYREQHRPTQPGVREVVASGFPERGHALFQDAKGRIWVSDRRAVGYLDSDRFVPVLSGFGPGTFVKGIIDGTRGDVWISTTEHLTRIGPNVTKETFLWSALGVTNRSFVAAVDPERGGMWLGLEGGGIAYLDDGRTAARYSVADGFGRGSMNHLRADPDGTIWAATEGGLSRIRNGRVVTLDSRSGLPCDHVLWSMPDNAGSVWLFMPCGLLRVPDAEMQAWAARSEG
ncbi:MAG TPA: hypothetical protein VKE96_07945 [Vicinamibacterales bacterium]|nr:hypothetical protein [Vicinamibacterales bacterium]